MQQYNGLLLCNKPSGKTSHDVVSGLRKILGQRKIGHTGTLDPLATGLMIICLGEATKIARFISGEDKIYEAEIRLGQRSITYDAEGIDPNTPFESVPQLSETEISDILKSFEGNIKQRVPAYSAVKVGGKRLYKSARKGEEVETPERNVFINSIEIIKINLPMISIKVDCTKGTYIRSLANDIGEYIGCGAYLSNLKRIVVGKYKLEKALNLNEIEEYKNDGSISKYIIPIESALDFPAIKVSREFGPMIINGRSPKANDITGIVGDFKPADFIKLLDADGKIRAIGQSEVGSSEIKDYREETFFKYIRVLH